MAKTKATIVLQGLQGQPMAGFCNEPEKSQEDQVITTNYTYDTMDNISGIDGSHTGSRTRSRSSPRKASPLTSTPGNDIGTDKLIPPQPSYMSPSGTYPRGEERSRTGENGFSRHETRVYPA
jgi:hypothetical protein